MAIISSGWSTSFIYQQDLTSYYMNNVLRSAIRPGVYNANLAVYYGRPSAPAQQSSQNKMWCLTIKKGTTFVFSNDYTLGYEGKFRRNFNLIESNGFSPMTGDSNRVALIKSVALYDMSIPITDTISNDSEIIPIFAYLYYNPQTSNERSLSSPSFFIGTEAPSTESYLYKTNTVMYESGSGAPSSISDLGFVKDGSTDSIATMENDHGSILNQYFLNLGFLVNTGRTENGKAVLAFTGRGLPEYRHSITMDTNTLMPDVIPSALIKSGNQTFSRVFFDIPSSFIGNTIYEDIMKSAHTRDFENSWESAYLVKMAPSDFGSSYVDVTGTSSGIDVIYATVSNIKSYSEDVSDVTISKDNGIKYHIMNLTLPGGVIPESLNLADWIDTRDRAGNTLSEIDQFAVLDISPMNVKRLSDSLIGVDIWDKVMDNVREDSEMDPNEITDIIPIAVIFKDTGNSMIPSNMLSYFGLQNQMSKINSLNVREHNIYNIIPVID